MYQYNFFNEICSAYKFLIPEIGLFLSIILGIIALFFTKNKKSNFNIIISLFIVTISLIYSLKLIPNKNFQDILIFNDLYSINYLTYVIKLIILAALLGIHIFSLLMPKEKNFINRFGIAELSVLINFSALGALFAVSSNNFIILYISLELQALSSYILVANKKDDLKSNEAALKYFVLGVLSSGLMLYGVSLIYMNTGSFSFEKIYYLLNNQNNLFSTLTMTGIVMVICALCFKLSAAPFHSWLADVYEGAHNVVVAFFGIIPKIMAAYIIYKLYHYVFTGEYLIYTTKIISIFIVMSLIIGSISAIKQKNFKRFLAYSAVANSGFVLLAILGSIDQASQALIIYFIAYMLGFYGLIGFAMFYWSENYQEHNNYEINSMHGLNKIYPSISIIIAFCLFSIAGIPPFIGFWGKLNILLAGISNLYFSLIIIALLTSVISLIYYLKIIKIMYFANNLYHEQNQHIAHHKNLQYKNIVIFYGITLIIGSFIWLII